jgi:hypothetical protein
MPPKDIELIAIVRRPDVAPLAGLEGKVPDNEASAPAFMLREPLGATAWLRLPFVALSISIPGAIACLLPECCT